MRVVQQPSPQDDPQRRKPDITKAQRILGWEPLVSDGVGEDLTNDKCHRLLPPMRIHMDYLTLGVNTLYMPLSPLLWLIKVN